MRGFKSTHKAWSLPSSRHDCGGKPQLEWVVSSGERRLRAAIWEAGRCRRRKWRSIHRCDVAGKYGGSGGNGGRRERDGQSY